MTEKPVRTVQVVVLRADGSHEVTTVPNVLAHFQRLVGGYLEAIAIPDITRHMDNGMIALVDEEGALRPNCKLNMFSPWFGVRLYGTIVVVRAEPGGDFIDLTADDLDALNDHFTYPFRG